MVLYWQFFLSRDFLWHPNSDDWGTRKSGFRVSSSMDSFFRHYLPQFFHDFMIFQSSTLKTNQIMDKHLGKMTKNLVQLAFNGFSKTQNIEFEITQPITIGTHLFHFICCVNWAALTVTTRC